MGQMSRMNRASRFIDNFADILTPRLGLTSGQTLVVKDVGISTRDGGGEEVIGCVIVQLPDGSVCALEFPGVLYDPEYSTRADVIEDLAAQFDLPREQVEQRMQDAEL